MLKKKTVLIGLGNIGLNYDLNEKLILTHSKSISKNKNLKLIYGVDKSPKQRKIFEKKYSIPTLSKLEKDKSLEDAYFFVISTPNHTHLRLIRKILSFQKLKYILLEKPGGTDFKNFQKITTLCKKKKVKLFINYNRLYDNNYSKISRLLKKMKKFTGVATYSRGLENNCSHILSFLNSFNLKKIKIMILKRGKNPDFIIKFKKGNVYFFNNPRDNISNNEFEIIGDNFKIRTKDEINTFEIFKIKKERFIKNNYIFSNKGKIIKFDKNNSQKNVLDNIFNKNNRKNISNIIEISYDTFKVISKIKSML